MDLSDDQFAILGCFVAMGVCGIIAAFTFHFGSAGKASQATIESRPLSFPAAAKAEQPSSERKAA